jgi:hypothetical protein
VISNEQSRSRSDKFLGRQVERVLVVGRMAAEPRRNAGLLATPSHNIDPLLATGRALVNELVIHRGERRLGKLRSRLPRRLDLRRAHDDARLRKIFQAGRPPSKKVIDVTVVVLLGEPAAIDAAP